jgi:hypothetical protein
MIGKLGHVYFPSKFDTPPVRRAALAVKSGQDKMSESDPRFSRLKNDPRFRRPKKLRSKVVVDDRFKGIFQEHEKKVERKAGADKSRPISTPRSLNTIHLDSDQPTSTSMAVKYRLMAKGTTCVVSTVWKPMIPSL